MTTQAARRLMIALTILGVVTLSAGVTFSLVQRASASAFDVCAVTSPYAPCTYTTIQAAINDPTGPNPILVAPGTYHETINITRNVGVFGPNYLFNPVVGGRGPEAIIDASGVGPIAVTVSAADTAIEGFTITGAHGNSSHIESAAIVGPSGINSVLVENNIIKDNYNGIYELGGTTVTITQNVIRNNSAEQFGDTCFSGAPYCNAIFDGAAFGTLNIIGNKIDETGGLAQFTNHFQRAMSIAPTPSGTLLVDSNTLFNSSTLANLTGTFNNNKISGDFGIRMIGGVNNFTIDSNTFTGLFSNAIVSHKANNSNLTITQNTIKQDLGDIQYAAGWVYNGSDDAAIDLDKLTGANNTIAENTIIYSGSNSYPNASVEAIRLRSGVTGNVTIDSNNFDGGNVGGPDTEALEIDPTAAAPNNTVNANLMRDFTYGVNDLGTTPRIYSLGADNCISGNSLYGYSALASGVTAAAEWWGSPLGPSPTSPAVVSYGNPVTHPNVDPSGFLLSPPQSACGGPVASNVQSNINPAPLNVPITVTAKLTTNNTSDAPVAAAYYMINGGTPQQITTTTTGTFGVNKTVHVSATLPGFTTLGTYTICVFGVDTYGQWGAKVQTTPKNCFKQVVNSANTTTTVTSNNNPSVFGQSVTFTITVASGAGTPTGNVSLTDNGNPLAGPLTLSSGVATYTTSSLSIGTHPIVATYAGDTSGTPIFNASTSNTLSQVVNKVGTSTTLTSAPNPSVSGQTVTISVKVLAADSSALTGSVVLKDGATTLGTVTLTNGVGSFTTSSLSVGTHNVTGAYSGDSTHDVSNGAASQTVNATPVVPTGSSNAYVRIAQSSESYATSDISIDGATTFPNVAACTVQPYYPITAGKHTFTVQSPSGGATIITETITLTAGQYYTLAVVGNSAKSITPALLVFEDNESVSSNQAKSRVYHLSDTLGPVQATAGSTTLAANLTFGNATSYTNQAPGTVTYSFQPSSGPALTDALSESANQVYSIFLMCNGQVTNTAATGVPVALPQTGYGSMPFWQNPIAARALLILGALLLLIGLGGFGSYLAFSRRRRLAI
jgi:hypothetical protein